MSRSYGINKKGCLGGGTTIRKTEKLIIVNIFILPNRLIIKKSNYCTKVTTNITTVI